MVNFVPVTGLNHAAYRCRDAEETRHFYEDILGLPLTHVVRGDVVSTGEQGAFAHLFFEMTDGGCIAFFDLGDNVAAEPSPNTPLWVNHIAFNVESEAHVDKAKARLQAAGVDVLGPKLHDGQFRSIYFFDPNGIRLELTVTTTAPGDQKKFRQNARAECDAWMKDKTARLASASVSATVTA
jgi:catechol 2,3-dioxygenase-like lactoylglutathione lyase family enzyme